MMEPHATIAAWEGDRLTLWTANQMVAWSVGDMAKTLGIPKENIRLVSPYIGGGFGGKLFIRADALMAALGAKAAKRPVKIAPPRPSTAHKTTHPPATQQPTVLRHTKAGKNTRIRHQHKTGRRPGR